MTTITHFIDGRATIGTTSKSKSVFDPATGVSDKTVILATAKDVAQAVLAAKVVLPAWQKMPTLRKMRILDRFNSILRERMGELAAAITSKLGKTVDDAKVEVTRGPNVGIVGNNESNPESGISQLRQLKSFDIRRPDNAW